MISFSLDRTISFKFRHHKVQILINSNNVWRDFIDFQMSAIATVVGESFNGKLTAKIDFLMGYFILPSLMLTL